jgi:hypothetical protein
MQDRPDTPTLLEAVARFLEQQVRPEIKDPALSFRLLIAANLCRIGAEERRQHEAFESAELERLSAVLGAAPEGDGPREQIRSGNRALAARIRTMSPADLDAARAHIRATLSEALSIVSPRFDQKL